MILSTLLFISFNENLVCFEPKICFHPPLHTISGHAEFVWLLPVQCDGDERKDAGCNRHVCDKIVDGTIDGSEGPISEKKQMQLL